MTFTTEEKAAAVVSMTDRELVAVWNIDQFPGIKVGRDHELIDLVSAELDARSIPHLRGRRTVIAGDHINLPLVKA